jgi:hypothetical protein
MYAQEVARVASSCSLVPRRNRTAFRSRIVASWNSKDEGGGNDSSTSSRPSDANLHRRLSIKDCQCRGSGRAAIGSAGFAGGEVRERRARRAREEGAIHKAWARQHGMLNWAFDPLCKSWVHITHSLPTRSSPFLPKLRASDRERRGLSQCFSAGTHPWLTLIDTTAVNSLVAGFSRGTEGTLNHSCASE